MLGINFTFKEALLKVKTAVGSYLAVAAATIGAIEISAKCQNSATRILALVSFLSAIWVLTAFFAIFTLNPLVALLFASSASVLLNKLKSFLITRC